MGLDRNYWESKSSPAGQSFKEYLLDADDEVVNPDVEVIFLKSDNATATNRTFTLLDGQFKGQLLTLNFASGSSYTCDLQSGGNVQLVEAWQPLQYECLKLMWDGTQWCEQSRSETAIVAGSIVNADISASAAIAFSKLAALTDGNILVGSGSNVATSVAVSGDVTIANTGAVTIAASAVEASMISDSDGAMKMARYSVAYTDLTGAGDGVAYVAGETIPDNSIIYQAIIDVQTTFAGDSDDSSTIKIGIEDQDNDTVAAVAISDMSNPWDAGLQAGIPVGTAATAFKLTAARQLAVTWTSNSDTTLSAGAMDVFVFYVTAAA